MVWSLVFVFLVMGFYLGLMFYKNSILSSLTQADEQLAALEKSRDKNLEQKLLNLKGQLSVVGPLISSHLFWSQGLSKIQSLVQPQVQFKSVNASSTAAKIVFQATAANYTTVAKQIAAFYADDSITDIVLNKASSLPTGRVDFTMQLMFDLNKFLVKSIKLPEQTKELPEQTKELKELPAETLLEQWARELKEGVAEAEKKIIEPVVGKVKELPPLVLRFGRFLFSTGSGIFDKIRSKLIPISL